jgi:predicted nucleotidyltransferase
MDATESIRAALSRLPQVRLAVLFGSRARGTAGPASDLDLGVLLDPSTPELKTRIEVELARASSVPLEVVYLDQAPPQLRFEISRDGVPLLERVPHAWVNFKARAMVDWWDWAPTARRIHQAALERLRDRVNHGPA